MTEQKVPSATESRESFKNGCRIHVCLSMLKKAILINIAQLQLIKRVTNNRYAFPLLEMIQGVFLTQCARTVHPYSLHFKNADGSKIPQNSLAISRSELSLNIKMKLIYCKI